MEEETTGCATGRSGAVLADSGEVMVNVLCAGEGRSRSRASPGRTIGLADPLAWFCACGRKVEVLDEGEGCPSSIPGKAREEAVTVKVLRAGEP